MAVSRSATLNCTSILRPTVRNSDHMTCMAIMTTQLGMDRNDVTLTTHTNSVSIALNGGLGGTVELSVVSDWCNSDGAELSLVSDWLIRGDMKLSMNSGWCTSRKVE